MTRPATFPYAMPQTEGAFVVLCRKPSGVEVALAHYASHADALRVVDHLRAIGCAARVTAERAL